MITADTLGLSPCRMKSSLGASSRNVWLKLPTMAASSLVSRECSFSFAITVFSKLAKASFAFPKFPAVLYQMIRDTGPPSLNSAALQGFTRGLVNGWSEGARPDRTLAER